MSNIDTNKNTKIPVLVAILISGMSAVTYLLVITANEPAVLENTPISRWNVFSISYQSVVIITSGFGGHFDLLRVRHYCIHVGNACQLALKEISTLSVEI
jgi:hypothetical protein